MEAYANALLIAIPVFVVLVLIEIAYGHFVKNQTHRILDTVSSLSSGMTNIIKDSLGLVLVLISYPTLVEYLALVHIESTTLVYVLAFIAMDFAGYWNHRLSHKINFFWNQHVIHHSSEEFNLACALRQSISNIIGYFPILLIPAALLGVPANIIAVLAPLHLFLQFWYHTKHIGKMGWLEYILVTPSQHRVHHAINPEYIDKNLGQIFCIWDRMFGTFQEELDDVPPVYGVLKPAATWNPIIINFQHLWRLIKDAWHTKSYKAKFIIWFMPTGWRPADVAKKYPTSIIEDVYHFNKYETHASNAFKAYATFQLVMVTLLLLFMFYQFGSLNQTEILTYGFFLFLSIYGYSSFMDKQSSAVVVEIVRSLIGLTIIFTFGDWFGINQNWFWASWIIGIYLVSTIFATLYFFFIEKDSVNLAVQNN